MVWIKDLLRNEIILASADLEYLLEVWNNLEKLEFDEKRPVGNLE